MLSTRYTCVTHLIIDALRFRRGRYCMALMHYAGSRNSIEHGLALLEVYCLSINCFAAARPHLTAASDNVALVLKRLALSCFELLLSVPISDIPYHAWMQFHHSVQVAHDSLIEYGSTDLQALVHITQGGGPWEIPVLRNLLEGQPMDTQELNGLIALEGESFMEMRIKHLEKYGEVEKALALNKACANCNLIPNQGTFRYNFVSQMCKLLPNDEAIMEISRLDGKDVLDLICNMETDGDENTAFILCTTYFTQQLQQENLNCAWELTLLWSKLQRRLELSLESFLERCLQFGAIAKTAHHLLFLIQVVQTEAVHLGLPISVQLCVKALQLPGQADPETKMAVCKTVACLLCEDLEVLRACQLTEFLLGPSQLALASVEELYVQPDQKYDEESSIIPNSLRCELLLALKAHWPFDPEFWDWKTLRRCCVRLLGLEPEEEEEEEEEEEPSQEVNLPLEIKDVEWEEEKEDDEDAEEQQDSDDEVSEETCSINNCGDEIDCTRKTEENPKLSPSKKTGCSERYLRWQKYKIYCQLCEKEVIEARFFHHCRKHVKNGVFTCPVCLQTFHGKQEFVSHTSQHIHMPNKVSRPPKKKKAKRRVDLEKEMEEDELDELEPAEMALDPSLWTYYQSTQDPDVLDHILEQTDSLPKKPEDQDHITFEYISTHFELQDREVYPCPATNCSKNFRLFKYLSVHLKAEHEDADESVRHYFAMKDRREKCPFCRRHFVTAYHHRRHRRVHYGERPYMCAVSDCGARFNTTSELVAHKQGHGFRLSYRCELQGCSLSFCDLGQLYHHEAQHFRDAAYNCTGPGCKKFYYSRKEFLKHLATHGISFTEEDFEEQRKSKRKLVDPVMEEVSMTNMAAVTSVVNGIQEHSSSAGSLPSRNLDCKGLTGALTHVAVCFDGKMFTCGFENCGKTFTKARDVQRHLKCVHPEQLAAEEKGHKKLEKSSKFKATKTDERAQDVDLPSPGPSPEDVSTINLVNPPTSESNITPEDLLCDILLGLRELSLNCSSPRKACQPISKVTPVPSPPTTSARSSSKPNKKTESDSTCQSEVETATSLPQEGEAQSADTESQTNNLISSFLVLSTNKPYTCDVKGCSYQSVTSRALLRHYVTKHDYSKEEVKATKKFLSHMFRPFKCHLCPKSYKQKKELRLHYLQMHKISEIVLEQMSCSVKRREEAKEAEQPKARVKQNLQKEKLEGDTSNCNTWLQKFQKKTPWVWRKLGWENGLASENRSGPLKGPASPQDHCEGEVTVDSSASEGRGSRRLVAKAKLCYILTKYQKPYHCVLKDCSSTFTKRCSLVRHLQTVHHYNRSQLCLEHEQDRDLQGIGAKKESAKPPRFPCKHNGCTKHFYSANSLWRHHRYEHHGSGKALSSQFSPSEKSTCLSEEPVPRFKCAQCNASYHLNSSLQRHNNNVHGRRSIPDPQSQQVRCEFEGCTRVFALQSNYKQHVFYRHYDYYDSLVLQLHNTQTKDGSASGCQKKLIVTCPKLPLRQSLRHCPKSQETIQQEDRVEAADEERVPESSEKSTKQSSKHRPLVFRTHEEALQMCQDRCLPEAYPCMVQDCDSVVTLFRSIRRHYVNCHKMSRFQFSRNQDKLAFTAEQLEELIQKKSVLPEASPTGVLKIECQAESENPGGPPHPMSLNSNTGDKSDGQDGLVFSEKTPSESNVLVAADDLLYGEPSSHAEDVPAANDHNDEDGSQRQSPPPPLIHALPLDLSPPPNLRIAVDECLVSLKESGAKLVSISSVPARQPLKRKNELSEPLTPATHAPNPMDVHAHTLTPCTFDLGAYKPMGFESSFLKFIQESKAKDEQHGLRPLHPHAKPRRDSHWRNCSVKENNERGALLTRSRRSRSAPLKPLHSPSEFGCVQDLSDILDNALTSCDDEAIKQLQYLRPVVVLERSKIFTS
uniref:C2H2-type domain-containing protein n=1 Tax=Denticeps clupeoides TaxID=299321 RepID=A0AAY3ZVH4_9TELE